eukprot:748789_1
MVSVRSDSLGSISDPHFPEELWDCFKEVFDYLSNGRSDLKQLMTILKERAHFEEEFGKQLKRSLQKTDALLCTGTSRMALEDLKQSSQSLAETHLQVANQLNEFIHSDLSQFIRHMKETKTNLFNAFDKSMKDVKVKTERHQKALERYRKAHKALESHVNVRNVSLMNETPKKKMDNLEKKVKSGQVELDVAHSRYGQAVEDLSNAQKDYDRVIAECLRDSEDLSRDRAACIARSAACLAACSQARAHALPSAHDTLAEAERKVDARADILQFINEKRTGLPREPYIEYLALPDIDVSLPGAGGIAPDMSRTSLSGGSGPAGNTGDADRRISDMSNPSGSATAPPVRSSGITNKVQFARVLYDTNPESGQDDVDGLNELSLSIGDIVKLQEDLGNGWWRSETQKGISGIVPYNYVEVIDVPSGKDPTWETIMRAGRKVCRALFDFVGSESDGELSFKTNDELMILSELEEWFTGQTASGKKGMFPANYVE